MGGPAKVVAAGLVHVAAGIFVFHGRALRLEFAEPGSPPPSHEGAMTAPDEIPGGSEFRVYDLGPA